MFGISPFQMLVVGVIALLLFGNRLPSVARSLGKSLTEFKKGMQGVQDEFRDVAYNTSRSQVDYDDREQASAPRFEPPKSAPRAEGEEQVAAAETDTTGA
jgi:sec-independent protein translocase protein TatA